MKKEKIKEFIIKHKKTVIACSVVCITLLIMVHMFLFNSMMNAGDNKDKVSNNGSNINPRVEEIQKKGAVVLSETVGTTEAQSTTESKKKQKTTTAPSTTKPRTESSQTATTASGVAIDNPDTSYSTGHVSLTDEDRDLLERLCYGEFGSGGFVGASLIAQSVKDAMYYVGFTSVAQVIREYKYTGSTTSGKNQACQQAVKYVFDENHDAVQHRIMYMYNPYMVPSQFHESQKFILSYENVRFFDKW